MNIIDTIDGALYDYEVGADAMRWSPDAETVRPLSPRSMRTITVNIVPQVQAFARSMQKVSEVLAKMIEPARQLAIVGKRIQHAQPHNTTRCDFCSPRANPAPLCIDGHAYARRRKGRNR